MSAVKDYFTNHDGRASTTSTLQVLGFIVLSAVIAYSVYLNRPYVPELCFYLAGYCGVFPISKGFASAYQAKKTKEQA